MGINERELIESAIADLESPYYLKRRHAAELLRNLKVVEAIPQLALRTDAKIERDSVVREEAVKALGKIGNESAAKALLSAAEEQGAESMYVRKSAIEALGQLEYHTERVKTSVIELLTAKLKVDYQYERRNAAEALGNIGDERAVNSLLEALGDNDDFVVLHAAQALGKIKITDTKKRSEVVSALSKILFIPSHATSTYSPKVYVPQPGKERVSNSTRYRAAEALGNIGGERGIGVLIDAFSIYHPDVNRAQNEALAKFGRRAVSDLRNGLKSKDMHTRTECAETLGMIKYTDKRTIKRAVTALSANAKESECKSTRVACVRALGEIRDESCADALILALRDEDSDVRWYSARGLGGLEFKTEEKRREGVAALCERLGNDEKKGDVRRAAAESLGSIAKPTDEDALEALRASYTERTTLFSRSDQLMPEFLQAASALDHLLGTTPLEWDARADARASLNPAAFAQQAATRGATSSANHASA